MNVGVLVTGRKLRQLEARGWSIAVKAAHLTLFEMLGYRWALSSGGVLVGKFILGDFFLANYGQPRKEIEARAVRQFSQFVQMVRPVTECPTDLRGTANDQQLYVCRAGALMWGAIVFIKTGGSMHGALLPLLESDRAADIFARFLSGGQDEIVVQLARFRGDHWSASKRRLTVHWPAAGPAPAEE